MSQIGWIEALRRYNLGGTAWCIPKKNTPAYDMVMKIRKGEEAKTPKELIAELEKKTGGKPKAEKKSMSISLEEKPKAESPKPKPKKKRTVKAQLPEEKPEPEKESKVEVPMTKGSSKNEAFIAELERIVELMKKHPKEVGVGYVNRFAAEGKRFRMSPEIVQDKGEYIVFNDRDVYRLLIDLDYKDDEISFQFAGGADGIHPDLRDKYPETVPQVIQHLETAIKHQKRDNPEITGFHLKKKKEEEDMPVYEYKDEDYEKKLEAFKKMVGAK